MNNKKENICPKALLFKEALNIHSCVQNLEGEDEEEVKKKCIFELQIKSNKIRYKNCPGDSCNRTLPINMFAVNYNMKDGYDVYCIKCNEKMRQIKNEKRERYKNWMKGYISHAPESYASFSCTTMDKTKKNKKNIYSRYTTT
jgi:hypothetical protein